ncbi:hypothetical protein [Peptoniphilus sp.]|uniref:hypothetical protein n=1 Tax=Peptoniphilus sp. TaxID=1971214 RepID=UPI0039939065
MKEKSRVSFLNHAMLTELPVLKVQDNGSTNKTTRILGSNSHDTYILGKDGGLHYYNLQCSEGTEYGGYEFVVEKDPDDYMDCFETANFLELMDMDAKRLNILDDDEYIKLKKELAQVFEKALDKEDQEFEKLIQQIIKDYKD